MKDFMKTVNAFIQDYESSKTPNPEILKEINKLFQFYTKNALENAYLAHYKQAIEQLSFEINGELTKIYYDFDNDTEHLPSGSQAKVQYFKGTYIITIPGKLPSIHKRILIGHELGHILISLLQELKFTNKSEIYKSTNQYPVGREFLASVLCYIMHIRQSDHYANEIPDNYIYNDQNKRDNLFNDIMSLTNVFMEKNSLKQ